MNEQDLRDLGFGAVVSRESRQRLLNRDGSFNVKRRGLGFWRSFSLYHTLLTISWTHFFLIFVGLYFAANALFALAYLACGPAALGGSMLGLEHHAFLRAFFFSVETLSTIGYGNITPDGIAANAVVTVEALSGLMGFALVTGLLFARFSRPTAKIMFSRTAVIAPYRGIRAFEFRIANMRRSELIEVRATVMYTRFEEQDGRPVRRFYLLPLERSSVTFFPLSWTIVHPIDEASPLNGLTRDDMRRSNAEFLVLLSGLEETFAQRVHARSSYRWDEVVWGAKFSDILHHPHGDEAVTLDVSRLDSIEPVA